MVCPELLFLALCDDLALCSLSRQPQATSSSTAAASKAGSCRSARLDVPGEVLHLHPVQRPPPQRGPLRPGELRVRGQRERLCDRGGLSQLRLQPGLQAPGVLAKSCAASWREPGPARRDSTGESLLGPRRAREVVMAEEQSSFLPVVGTPALRGSAQDGEFGENLRAAEQEGYPALGSDPRDSDLLCNNEEDAQTALPSPRHAQEASQRQAAHLPEGPSAQASAAAAAAGQGGPVPGQLSARLHHPAVPFQGREGRSIHLFTGQVKLEGSIFRDLTYAVLCIQNSKGLWSLLRALFPLPCAPPAPLLRGPGLASPRKSQTPAAAFFLHA